jgi:hypothetical protein
MLVDMEEDSKLYLIQIDQPLIIADITEYDEGLIELINFINTAELDKETFEVSLSENYSIKLTDNSIYDLIPDGKSIKVEFEDRFKYLQLVLKARLCEVDNQIAALKKGLCKLIPESLLKCKFNLI